MRFFLLFQHESRLLQHLPRPEDSAGRNADVVQVLPFQFFLLKDTERLDVDFHQLSCYESSDLPRGTEQVGPAHPLHGESSGLGIKPAWMHTLASLSHGPGRVTELPSPQDPISSFRVGAKNYTS